MGRMGKFEIRNKTGRKKLTASEEVGIHLRDRIQHLSDVLGILERQEPKNERKIAQVMSELRSCRAALRPRPG